MRLAIAALLLSLAPGAARASMCVPMKPRRIVTPADGATGVPRGVEARVYLLFLRPDKGQKLLREDYRLVDGRGAVVPLSEAKVEADVLSMKPRAPLAADAEHEIQLREGARWVRIARFRTGQELAAAPPSRVRIHRAGIYIDDVSATDPFVPPASQGQRLRKGYVELELTSAIGPLDAIAMELEGVGVVAVSDASRLGRAVPVARGEEGLALTSIGAGRGRCWPYHDAFFDDPKPRRVRTVVWSATGERLPSMEWEDAPLPAPVR